MCTETASMFAVEEGFAPSRRIPDSYGLDRLSGTKSIFIHADYKGSDVKTRRSIYAAASYRKIHIHVEKAVGLNGEPGYRVFRRQDDGR